MIAADATSGTGILGLDFGAFLIQLLTFVIVLLVLKRWAFGPIIQMLSERRKFIEDGVNLGESMRAEKAKLADEVAGQLQRAREQADQVLAGAQADARKVIEEAEAAAQTRTEAIVRTAHRQIQITAERERAQLEHELVHLVADVGEAVVGQKLTAERDTALIDQALKKREAA